MPVEVAVNCEEVKKCADKLNKLSARIQSYNLALKLPVSKGVMASRLITLGDSLDLAADRLAEVIKKAADTTSLAGDTFNQMDETLKY